MIEDRELPSEYVSIRVIWLKGIEECRKTISQVANIESGSDRKMLDVVGARTICYTVEALYLSLVDFGMATVLSDVEKWKKQYFDKEVEKIWSKKSKKQDVSFIGLDDEEIFNVEEKWWLHSKQSKKLYHKILQILNKYNMLFPEQPAGYSNVIMEEVKDE